MSDHENTQELNEWSNEKLEREEQSKKEKEQKLKPGKEEVYLLLIALLLIASGPVGIGVAVGLVGGYGVVKAADLRRYIAKAKKVKNQRKLREQNYKDTSSIEEDKKNEKEEIETKEQEQINIGSDESVDQDYSKTHASKECKTLSDCYKNEHDIVETLSYLDDNILDHISKMSEEEIKNAGTDLAKDGDSRKIFEQILALKRDLGTKTTEENTAEEENQLEAESLNAKLNKLINASNQPNNSFIPFGPSPTELKSIDPSLESENSERTNQDKNIIEVTQDAGFFPPVNKPQRDIERHSILFPSQENTGDVLDQVLQTEKKTKNDISNPFSQFLQPQIKLTDAGVSYRANEHLRKSSNSIKEKTQTTIQTRKSK